MVFLGVLKRICNWKLVGLKRFFFLILSRCKARFACFGLVDSLELAFSTFSQGVTCFSAKYQMIRSQGDKQNNIFGLLDLWVIKLWADIFICIQHTLHSSWLIQLQVFLFCLITHAFISFHSDDFKSIQINALMNFIWSVTHWWLQQSLNCVVSRILWSWKLKSE